MISQILVPFAGTLFVYLLYQASRSLYHNLTSPLRYMNGPKNSSFIWGNFKEMTSTTEWRKEFGANFRFAGLFGVVELHTSDVKAVSHIATKARIYQRVPSNRTRNRRLLGRGILSVELDEHKRIRGVMNPAFGVAQIRAVTEIFIEKATQLRDIWARQVAQGNGATTVEVLSGLRSMTLDVIGFNYRFDALDPSNKSNELNEVFTEMFHSPQANNYLILQMFQAVIPLLRFVPTPGASFIRAARNKMYVIGKQIVSKSKADIQGSNAEKALAGGRDLLSVLIKANTSSNIPETHRLSEAEVIGQIPAFLVAGHETTSSATAWALYALSENIAAQSTLREELFTIASANPTMEELNSLPYLEQIVRETLRLYAPVVYLQRMAMENDILPLAKPYIDKSGKAHESIPIRKGQIIHIPILAINTDEEIWGHDAAEFKPERWGKESTSVTAFPGAWANLLTFWAGPHNCIGFRFSLVEMKALLFTLIRSFEFQRALPKGAIGPGNAGVLQRPTVLADKGKGSGLPLLLKPYKSQP